MVCTVVYAGRSSRSMASCTSRTVDSPRRQSTLMTSVSNFVSAMRSLAMRAYYSCSSASSSTKAAPAKMPALPDSKSALAAFLVELHPLAVHFHLGLVDNLVFSNLREDVARLHRGAAGVHQAVERHLVGHPARRLLDRVAGHVVDRAGDERLRLLVVAEQHAHRVRMRILRGFGLGVPDLDPCSVEDPRAGDVALRGVFRPHRRRERRPGALP